MSVNSQTVQTENQAVPQMEKGNNPMLRAAAVLFLANAALWAALLFRWMTYSVFDWKPLPAELALATLPPLDAYLVYSILLLTDLFTGLGLLRHQLWARWRFQPPFSFLSSS